MDEQEAIYGETPNASLSSRDQHGGSPSTVKDVAPSRRRWYQFTLRAVLALILFGGLLLTAWRVYIAPYRAQAQAAELIARLGGTYQADAFPS